MYRQLNLKTLRHLAHRLGVPLALLESVLADKSPHYHPKAKVTKPGAEPRPIVLLSPVVKEILKHLNDLLQDGLDHPPYMHGGMKGRTIITNARPHLGADFVLKIDIRKFFPSVTTTMVVNALTKHAGFSESTAQITAALATYDNKLITGSPASTVLASLVIREGTERIYGLVRQRHGNMTVFVDDITISGHRNLSNIEPLCVKWLEATGVIVHPKKRIRTSGPNAVKIVTGSDITHGLDAPRGFRRGVQAMCQRMDVKMNEGILPTDAERASLVGKLNHLGLLNPGMAKFYRRRFKHVLHETRQTTELPYDAQRSRT